MTYSEFTLDSVQSLLGLKLQTEKLFPIIEPVTPPDWLIKSLAVASSVGFSTEKARSEFFVAPILLASRELNHERFFLYSGQKLDADPQRGLTGECDFILSHAQASVVLQTPIMTLVEAKKQDYEAGMGQCIAQMVGAQIFNQKKEDVELPIFGCVTTGEGWQFLKLADSYVTVDVTRYALANLELILGMFRNIVGVFEAQHKFTKF